MSKMKMVISGVVISISLLWFGGQNYSVNAEAKNVELTIGEEYSVKDYAEFTFLKINTTKKIEGSCGSDYYFENQNVGETYVDLVINYKNETAEAIDVGKIVSLSAIDEDGKKYDQTFYGVEINDYTWIEPYCSITPLTTNRVHCAVSVPENIKTLSLILNV